LNVPLERILNGLTLQNLPFEAVFVVSVLNQGSSEFIPVSKWGILIF